MLLNFKVGIVGVALMHNWHKSIEKHGNHQHRCFPLTNGNLKEEFAGNPCGFLPATIPAFNSTSEKALASKQKEKSVHRITVAH